MLRSLMYQKELFLLLVERLKGRGWFSFIIYMLLSCYRIILIMIIISFKTKAITILFKTKTIKLFKTKTIKLSLKINIIIK